MDTKLTQQSNSVDVVFTRFEEIEKKTLVCTMKHTKDIVKILNKFGKNKYPSMKELYMYCFGKEIENAHNSKYDVINLHAIIKHMYEYGYLQYDL